MDQLLLAHAERSSMALVNKKQIQMQFWDHVLSCLKMPAGGVNGRGSMHCEFEFVAGSEEIVQFIMEDLLLQANHRYNFSLPPPTGSRLPASAHTMRSICTRSTVFFVFIDASLPKVVVATAAQFWQLPQTLTQSRFAFSPLPPPF